MRATPDVARATPTSARRRRERRIRSFFRHEQVAIKMAVVTAQHHSAQRCCTIATQTVDSPSVIEYVAPAPAVTYAAPAPVVGYVSSAPSVTFAAPASVFEYVAPAPVFEYIAPEPAVSFVAPSQQLRPAYTASGVNLHASVEVSASQVVGSLPLGEVFAAPVFHHVHHEQRAGGDMTEIFANFPVVQEQGVVGFLPLVEEFTAYVARRPSPLVEVWPSVRVQRHVVEQLADIAPMVQILDSPEPQMVAQLLEVFRLLDTQLPDEQVIFVPKISCSPCPSRSRVPEPQSAERLVEVPTVLTPTRIALQVAEQIVDTPLEEDEDSSDELLEYFCEDCVFLCETPTERFSSSGSMGTSSLMTSSRALVILHSCFDLLEVEESVFLRGRTLSTLVDLPNTSTRCALRRRSWLAGSMMRGRPRGEGLGIPSPHLGCHLRTLRSCSSSTSSSTSLPCRKRRSSWSRLFSRLLSFHSCSTSQVLDVPVVLVVLCSQCACPQLQLRSPS